VKATHSAAALIAAKRQKTVPHPSLLLGAQPEILWKVYSFLSLKEALLLCHQTHRHHFNELSNDLYQYSLIMIEDTMKERKFHFPPDLSLQNRQWPSCINPN
jgi:hypothetical protein